MRDPDQPIGAAEDPLDPTARVDRDELVARLAEELRAAEDRADMLANRLWQAGHDLNGELTALEGYIELLVAEQATADETWRHLIGSGRRLMRRTAELVPPTSSIAQVGSWRGERCDLAAIVGRELADRAAAPPRIRPRIVDTPVTVGLASDDARELVRALVSEAVSVTAASEGLDLELRTVPPPSRPAVLADARLRISGVVAAGVSGLPVNWLRGDLQGTFHGHGKGVVFGDIADGRVTIDWWIPIARPWASLLDRRPATNEGD